MSMDEALLSSLARWTNFYVIVGSSAGALTGLQFVVITLIRQTEAASSMREIRAFGTPNVVHFCAALLISVLMNVPWVAVSHLTACLAATAAIGFAYSLTVIRHASNTTHYSPDAADWFWFAILPTVMFMLLGLAAVITTSNPGTSFFLIAATSVAFLFNGIRNAWDTVTYLAVGGQGSREGKE